jgi:hypothetical protein
MFRQASVRVSGIACKWFGLPQSRFCATRMCRASRIHFCSGQFPHLLRVADRLFATEAIALGFELDCPLPFSEAEYEKDFPTVESTKEFRDLLSHALGRVLELDGPTQEAERPAAYEAVGRVVLDRCDLLMAIWDGEPARGLGGTGQIVELAFTRGMPILWIHPRNAAVLKTREGDVPLEEDALRRQLMRLQKRPESTVSESTPDE